MLQLSFGVYCRAAYNCNSRQFDLTDNVRYASVFDPRPKGSNRPIPASLSYICILGATRTFREQAPR